MIEEKLSPDDFALYEILRHPVLCWEFIQNVDRYEHEEEFWFTYYQKEFICDFSAYVSLCCGRAVGKTEALTAILIWVLLNNIFDEYIVYSVPNKAQLEPVWARITRLFRSNSVLKTFVLSKKGINSSSNTINLLNGATLLCRIAGTMGDGRNVIGLHTPFEIVDEAGYYPWGTWVELQPTLNTWTVGMRLIVSGVPTGLREQNVLYRVDMQEESYTKHRVAAHQNPRYTDEDEKRSLKNYGQPDSDNYIHMVLGRHGRPTFAVFDRGLMDIKQYPVSKIKLNGIKLSDDLSQYIERISLLPSVEKSYTDVIMGIDLGYTDPTAILVLKRTRDGQFKFHAKIQLNKVPYPIQAQVIDYLDTKYKPSLIGIDEGHAGTAEVQKLQMEPRFAHKNYKQRLIPVKFNASVVIGMDEDGKEIKQKTRPYSISVLQQYSNEHKIVYSTTDLEIVAELERMVYIKLPSGNRVYRTLTPKGGKEGDDHFTSALLCASMAWYLNHDSVFAAPQQKLLISAGWNIT
jgi:hypothetical protein